MDRSSAGRSVKKYVIGLLMIFAVAAATTAVMAQSVDWGALLKQTVPGADKFTQVTDLSKYKSRDQTKAIFPAYKSGAQIGVVFYSAPYGYKSNIHTLVAMDMKGTITRVNVFNHEETPAYVVPLDDGSYLRQFQGITLTDRLSFIIGGRTSKRGDIQAITNGTSTSKPIALSVSEARKLFVEIYGTPQ